MTKKTVIKGCVFFITFLAALLIISAAMNQGNTDMTVEMSPASFPLVYMSSGGERINCLHGYSESMDSSNLRDTITPLGEGRSLHFTMHTYGTGVKGISFEVRSMDGSRLVEDTPLYNYVENDNEITCSFTIKDLIEQNQEYKFILLAELEDGRTVRYYTRIIQGEGYHAQELLSFVREFHEKTFDKEAAQSITKYLESNSDGDNTTYARVDIHSSFHQITWGDLAVSKVAEPILDIRELGTQTAFLKMSYVVTMKVGKDNRFYRVEEYYRVRYTQERIYLLDFERTMHQFLNPRDAVFNKNKIELGIADPEIVLVESDGGNIFAFVNENKLYAYNVTENKFAQLYGFYDEENADYRTIYNAHDIKILSVDETGNIEFMVYGYMNRGRYEGRIGIQVFRYIGLLNTIEEEVFIPYHDSYDILKKEVEQLSYVNKRGILYLMLDNCIYAVNLEGKQQDIVVSGLTEREFRVSDSGRMLAWQIDGEADSSTVLRLMNLNTGKTTDIQAGNDRFIAPLGFMGEDLIYGVAVKSDVVRDKSGRVIFPMEQVKIQNENGDVFKTYRREGIYVTGCSIAGNQITLERVIKNEDGSYIETKDGQINTNDIQETGNNTVEVAVTQNYEKIVQIAVKSSINAGNVKVQTPREVLFEGGREVILEPEKEMKSRFFVYGKNGVEGIYTEAASAINHADEISGVVTLADGSYVWVKGNRSLKNQIMKIQEAQVTPEKNSMAVCLDTILKYEGVLRNTELWLNRGETPLSILRQQLPEAEIMDLSGCSLDAVLYYVNRDIPVLAILEDGSAVLIIGFNELNTVLMDPVSGKIYKKGMLDSTELFAENGNSFLTYVR